VLVSLLILLGSALVAPALVSADDPPGLEPIDPQVVTQAADQDWDDYHPIPTGPNYSNNGIPASIQKWDVGLILADFPDTPFAITQPAGSTAFGNPGPLGENIPRANVPSFYVNWLNSPSAANNFQSMNRYWMEDTYGKYGVNLVGYGPYQLFGDQGEYFIDDIAGSNNSTCNVQTRSANSIQANVTSIQVTSSASFSVGKILTNVGPDLGGGGTLSATRTVTAIPDATHIETGPATTVGTTSLAGTSTFRPASVAGIAAGHVLNIGWDDRLENRTVAAVGDGSGATTLSAAAPAGSTNIKFGTATGLTAGETILLEGGVNDELVTIQAVGTPTAGGTGLTLTAPITAAHASGGNITATWVSVTAPLTHGHANNTIVRDMNTTPLASVAANTYLHTCNRNFRTDAAVAWADHVSAADRNALDNFFVVSAGQDESGTWQEFGEMQFTGGPSAPDTVPDSLGPPNAEITQNWAATRYIPWTSWRSAATVWPSASGNSSTEGEGSGMAVYAHELTHNLGISDNYNNPYIAPFQRAATGYWSMMSRGSFNGPGGTHTRWNIPSTMGTALGSQHVLRDKIKLGFVTPPNFTDVNRNGLATSGLVVLDILAREVDPGGSAQSGIRINLDGGDQTVACAVMATPRLLAAASAVGDTNIKVDSVAGFTVNSDYIVGDRGNDEMVRVQSVGNAGAGGSGITFTTPLTKAHAATEIVSNRLTCSGGSGFNNYNLEVVQQLGADSFQPDTGVLIEKNRTSEGTSCGTFTCFAWVVDAHPTDINMLDFHRPDGTDQWVTTGDPRQLTDAAFHAGLNSGSLYEWEDTRNNLHFYIIDKHVDEHGQVRYKVAVQNISGNGSHQRGVDVPDATPVSLGGNNGYCNFQLNNTGTFANFANPHPENVDSLAANDVYRLSASATGNGWHAQLGNALASAAFGASTEVPVYVTRDAGADTYGSIQLTATSVSDGTKTDVGTCSLDDVAPVTTATLAPDPTNGYYNPDPTVTLTADDDGGAGVASTEYKLDDDEDWTLYSAPFVVTGDGDHTLLYRSTDLAGNAEDDNSLDFTIDTTGPEITITAPVTAATQVAGDPGNYPLNSSQLADYACSDAISGVATDTCVGTVADGAEFDTSTVGYHSFTVDVEDVAGNPSTKTIQYNVYWDQWSNFTGNISGTTTNVVQAGAVVPVKFSLGGDFGLSVFKTGSPTSQQVNCGNHALMGSPSAATSPGGNSFVYDGTQYQFNWKTVAGWKNTCRVFTVQLVDNTTHTAYFQFIK
jgi:M6 family metalloprotease-like protein